MNTIISAENPFNANRYGYLWEKLNLLKKGRHLDYGTYDGSILIQLGISGVIAEGVGVDINKSIISSSENIPKNILLQAIESESKLPFENDSFDTISILDVIEHVSDQKFVFSELNRILKTGGKIIVTVPRKHIFTFLDIGNFKFIFPRLHKIVYTFKHSKEEYQKIYVECTNGLFGDVEKEKMWHQHFSNKELTTLLAECGFTNFELDGSGLFTRPLSLLSVLLPFTNKVIKRIYAIDYKRFEYVNLFCIAEKRQSLAKG